MKVEPGLISSLRSMHEELRAAIRQRLVEFSAVPSSDYFYELTYCLLTPQSSAVNAGKVVEQLRRARFHDTWIDPEPFLRSPLHYIRFHRTKAKRLLELRERFIDVAAMLLSENTDRKRREWLVKNVKGLGYKEATHFLRNIGKNGQLTILDRHILRNLRRYGVIRSLPKTLTKKEYLRIEKRFQQFANEVGIPVNELDLVFWSAETGEILK